MAFRSVDCNLGGHVHSEAKWLLAMLVAVSEYLNIARLIECPSSRNHQFRLYVVHLAKASVDW